MSLRTYVALTCDAFGCPEESAPALTDGLAVAAALAAGWTRIPLLINGQRAAWRHLCPDHSGDDPA